MRASGLASRGFGFHFPYLVSLFWPPVFSFITGVKDGGKLKFFQRCLLIISGAFLFSGCQEFYEIKADNLNSRFPKFGFFDSFGTSKEVFLNHFSVFEVDSDGQQKVVWEIESEAYRISETRHEPVLILNLVYGTLPKGFVQVVPPKELARLKKFRMSASLKSKTDRAVVGAGGEFVVL
jgi:hypothetical protein